MNSSPIVKRVEFEGETWLHFPALKPDVAIIRGSTADENGNLGRVYGAQWCDWRTTDGRSVNQIDQVIAQLQRNPDSRRHIVSRAVWIDR